jgi:signal recognition particle GTPase
LRIIFIELKHRNSNTTMSTLIQDIQTVRSLRKDLRDPKLPLSILNAIESVHNCIKSGTDLNGWKKVDWRGGGGGGGAASGSASGSASGGAGGNRSGYADRSNHSGHSGSSSSKNSFFGNRGGNSGNNNSNSAFGNSMNRSRPPTFNSSRPHQESPQSIPLSSPTSVTSTPNVTHAAHNANNTTQSVSNTVHNNSSSATNTNSNSGFITPNNNKYVSRFKKNTEEVDDTILNTIILGKLNKFSIANYDEIKEFITHIIASGQTDMIKCFMGLVFQKAASEEMFCPLYAKLLSELSSRYPELLTEMSNLYEQYMAIFEEVETSAQDYNELVKRNVEKKYRRGYSQFLAELIKHQVINKDVFLKTIDTIIKQVNNKLSDKDSIKLIEEYADCMMKIMKAINTDSTTDSDSDSDEEDAKYNMMDGIKETLKTNVRNNIKPLTQKCDENCGLSTKARFTFLDIYETINTF